MLRAVARNFSIHRVAPGERVVHEGESLETVYFIGSGSFEVTQKGRVVGLLGKITKLTLFKLHSSSSASSKQFFLQIQYYSIRKYIRRISTFRAFRPVNTRLVLKF